MASCPIISSKSDDKQKNFPTKPMLNIGQKFALMWLADIAENLTLG